MTIYGPLIVVPDGSWQVLISVLALLVSAITLWFTLAARPRARAVVSRFYVSFGSPHDPGARRHHDGDEVTVVNVGRAPLIISNIQVISLLGKRLKAEAGPRGLKGTRVDFPTLPASLPPGGVITAWFPSAVAGEKAGVENGFEVTTLRAGGFWWRSTKERKLVIKASETVAVQARQRGRKLRKR